MDHVAIMKKSWGLLPKILTGEKSVESRWYKNRTVPWNKIKRGDNVYFKNSGEPVTLKTSVSEVLQLSELTPEKVKKILFKYRVQDGLKADELDKYYQLFRDKNYCLLVFLKNPKKVKPFKIDKAGYGTMSAWITVDNIKKLIKK